MNTWLDLVKWGRRERVRVWVRPTPLNRHAVPRAYMRFTAAGPRSIHIAYNPVWTPMATTELIQLAQARGIDNIRAAIVEAIMHHELGHRDICPRSLEQAQEMISMVAWVLDEGGKYSVETARYISNYIADLIVNTVLERRLEGFATGLMAGYYEQLDGRGFWRGKTLRYLLRLGRFRFSRSYDKLFSVFLGTQLELFQDAELLKLMEPLLTRQAAVTRAVEEIADLLDGADLEDRARWPDLCKRIAGVLLTFENYGIQVFGHTDDVGTEQYNLDLSKRLPNY